jgi:hypothetical protein
MREGVMVTVAAADSAVSMIAAMSDVMRVIMSGYLLFSVIMTHAGGQTLHPLNVKNALNGDFAAY